ncbi:MAG: hypothetical protein KDC79_15615 [Cyclobacteriaceae bacterium]|nr:hypothetical protein [Cyclobacteriaceae bacterium]
MKYHLLLIPSILCFVGCTTSPNHSEELQAQIDSLKTKLATTYKPGFGEFMSSIQAHHIKLWYAGKNQNWKLADFEVHEIMESIEDIRTFETDRPERKELGMITPALDSINFAIEKQDTLLFKNSFMLLTNTCNKCHQTVNFGFNVVKIPSNQPFSNQSFKVDK